MERRLSFGADSILITASALGTGMGPTATTLRCIMRWSINFFGGMVTITGKDMAKNSTKHTEMALSGYSGGYHNQNLELAKARIVQGGSWKNQRVITIVPCGDMIPAQAAMAMWSLIFPPNQPSHRIAAIGDEVGVAYSNAIKDIVEHPELSKWEYILTVEHDNIPPPDGLVRLVKDMEQHPEYACIGGLYWTKGPEGVPQIWGDPRDPMLNYRPQIPVPNSLQECCGTGMGFNLWRISMFKDPRLRRPWFVTKADFEGVGTQDLYFWSDARKHGYRCAIDTSILVGHLDYNGSFGERGLIW